MFTINFRVKIQHSDEAARNVSNLLRRNSIIVYDLREADIVKNDDLSKVGEVYLLCCKGSVFNYYKIKMKYYHDEEILEGFKTLS